jgi:D-glycero-alpha-D-manno-heptose-7-phosphate kinase
MLISRTPFRISFAGGGTDLQSFYKDQMGAVVSTTIDKYIYLAMHPFFFREKIQLKYSKTELVSSVEEIEHQIFKAVLKEKGITGIDINSIADAPSGTGLGSSSSFTVGLLNVVHTYMGENLSKEELASNACYIEIDRLKNPIGKQDQYAAAYGGLNHIKFFPDGTVNVDPIKMENNLKEELDRNLIMIFTEGTRSASKILKKQNEEISKKNKIDQMNLMVGQAEKLRESLESGRLDDFGQILHEGWNLKKSLTSEISNTGIDEIYQKGIDSGALGGKLCGAGGGGFILFYCPLEKQDKFRQNMSDFFELKFNFESKGSKIINLMES